MRCAPLAREACSLAAEAIKALGSSNSPRLARSGAGDGSAKHMACGQSGAWPLKTGKPVECGHASVAWPAASTSSSELGMRRCSQGRQGARRIALVRLLGDLTKLFASARLDLFSRRSGITMWLSQSRSHRTNG